MSPAGVETGRTAAGEAPPRSPFARLRALHSDRRAQILPLVFFLGIAFFTGVVLVIDTGRVVKDREETQSAVDAASVSGVTTLARGMNYVASNNITMAKILATVVILRAFDPAIDMAKVTLEVWQALGEVLSAIPYTAAAGAAILVKVQQERAVLNVLDPAVDAIKDVWDNDGDGVAWKVMQALTLLGDALVHSTPVLAQYSARRVFEANLPDATGAQAWMLPLYPSLPACKGKFGDFFDKTKKYTERYGKPIIIAGWLVLTLSGFGGWYEASLSIELRRLFTGEGGSLPPEDPDTARLKEIKKELEEIEEKRVEAEARKAQIEADLASLKARRAAGEDDLDDDIAAKEQDLIAVKHELDVLEARAEALEDESQEIMDRRMGNGSAPDSNPDLGDLGGSSTTDKDYPRPWMIEGSGWPGTFSYPCLAWRDAPDGLLPTRFKKPMDTMYVFAAARLLNPTQADLWTPDWRARLVKTDLAGLTNPFGTVKGDCGEGGGGGGTGDLPGLSPPDADQQKGILEKLTELSKH